VNLIVAGCLACAIALFDAPGTRANPVQVELDAFSGSPNPVWQLDADLAVKILTRLRELQPSSQAGRSEGGLGYRGFVLRPDGGGSIEGYDTISIAHGRVLAQRGDRLEILSDHDRTLEWLLLESAKAHVPEQVLQYIRSEIAR